MTQNAHATRNLQLLRDLAREQDWYVCDRCHAKYRSRNARVMCCSDAEELWGGAA